MARYSISQISEILEISPYTLRYYEKEHLLPPVARENGRRVYTDEDIDALRTVQCLKQSGMSIKEIRRFLRLAGQGNATLAERRQIFYEQEQEVLRQIEALNETLKKVRMKEQYYDEAMKAAEEEKK